jgi:DMSO/TMAO reductase YedYZ molybdopterin-dependent catalytic subunit
MTTPDPQAPVSRRNFMRAASVLATALSGGIAGSMATSEGRAASAVGLESEKSAGTVPTHPLLTPAGEFRDVSRGDPKIHLLPAEALVRGRLTPETWRLEITADHTPNPAIKDLAGISKPLTLADGTALDLATLMELGRKHGVKYLKAMQCMNIPTPLGQGLWEGVPLRDVLRLCGAMRNVRRIYYWGFHNNDPKQRFQSSLSYTQVMETAPGELPAFLAYRLNGEPISLMRGGPVRMVIPWAHGFKSIKWLQQIVVTNDYKTNDTYAEQNNDPESHLKTAAYLDDLPKRHRTGQPIQISGLAISGLSGLKRVEYALSREDSKPSAQAGNEVERWIACQLEEPPRDWRRILPTGVSAREVLGFDPKSGKPASRPLRYSMISWSATLKSLPSGKYTVRARAVDLNGFEQPEPRPNQRSGGNALEVREFEVG